jgi:hypothetical protein
MKLVADLQMLELLSVGEQVEDKHLHRRSPRSRRSCATFLRF